MIIWFIEIGEPLPVEQGKRLLRYGMFTNWLAGRGHDVTWWTCNFSHAIKAHVTKPGTYKLPSGVRLSVLPGRGYRKNVSPGRFLHQRDFAKKLAKALDDDTQKPDLIICPIPTVESADVISAYARKHEIPYIIDIRDNWPDDLVRRFPGILRPVARAFFSPLFHAARRATQGAASISGVTRLQRDYGLSLAGRPADAARDTVFYLGYTRQPVSAAARNEAAGWWREQGLNSSGKIVCFTGTLGVSFDLGPAIACARRLHAEGRSDIQFVIAGDGGARAKLMDDAADVIGKTILFPGWIDQAKIDAVLSASTMALAPYIPNTTMSLPNKFFEYMAYGLPVLSSCTGESEELIREHGFGVQYDPKDFDAFYKAVVAVADEQDKARAMSEASLNLFETKFNQSLLFAQMEEHMKKTAMKNTARISV